MSGLFTKDTTGRIQRKPHSTNSSGFSMALTILRSHPQSAHPPSLSLSKPTPLLFVFAFPVQIPEAPLWTLAELNKVLRNSITTLGLVWENPISDRMVFPNGFGSSYPELLL